MPQGAGVGQVGAFVQSPATCTPCRHSTAHTLVARSLQNAVFTHTHLQDQHVPSCHTGELLQARTSPDARMPAALPSLAEGQPQVAAQWHSDMNGGLTPADVKLGSHSRVWWRCLACKCGHPHEWQAVVKDRCVRGRGCPFCSGHKPCRCNSLAAVHPGLLTTWDYAANAPLRPEHLKPRSNRAVAWQCTKHEPPHCWTTRIADRTHLRRPSGCPQCSRQGLQ